MKQQVARSKPYKDRREIVLSAGASKRMISQCIKLSRNRWISQTSDKFKINDTLPSKSRITMMRGNVVSIPPNRSFIHATPQNFNNAERMDNTVYSVQPWKKCVIRRQKRHQNPQISKLHNGCMKMIFSEATPDKKEVEQMWLKLNDLNGSDTNSFSSSSKNTNFKSKGTLKSLSTTAYSEDPSESFHTQSKMILGCRGYLSDKITKSIKKGLKFGDTRRKLILKEVDKQIRSKGSIFLENADSEAEFLPNKERRSSSKIYQRSVQPKKASAADKEKLGIFQMLRRPNPVLRKDQKVPNNWSFTNEYSIFADSCQKRAKKMKNKQRRIISEEHQFCPSKFVVNRNLKNSDSFNCSMGLHQNSDHKKMAQDQISPTKIRFLNNQSSLTNTEMRFFRNKDLADFCNSRQICT
ncbi:unnamed protein product [Moneuplotes crassus]|uniref:Uncharacterized protein n=1 Tax=Euplotes crassus TaxID=5936 RepID=A0AAD1UFV6_EUPCR|nr:unnamed protein product [Moneuplotes crassus]